MINLLSNDVVRFEQLFTFLHFFWLMPLQVILVTYLIYRNMGLEATLAGVAVITLQTIPFQSMLHAFYDFIEFFWNRYRHWAYIKVKRWVIDSNRNCSFIPICMNNKFNLFARFNLKFVTFINKRFIQASAKFRVHFCSSGRKMVKEIKTAYRGLITRRSVISKLINLSLHRHSVRE